MPDEIVFDAWTAMNFKRAMGNRKNPGHGWAMPTWTGRHNRRLMAYRILAAYIDNTAREFLAQASAVERSEHREYGDAALIRDTILSALLGDEQRVAVPGAEEDDPDAGRQDQDAPAKLALEQWLQNEWDLERGDLKLQEVERDAVGLGDGVWSVEWSEEKGRARIRVWDPGFYFPVLTDGNEDDFPRKVHIAWEVPEEDRVDKNKAEIHRCTWELRSTDVEVQYLWNEKPTTLACFYTESIFALEQGNLAVDDLNPAGQRYIVDETTGEEQRDVNLGIDFVPVVHEPNTVAIKEHYGRSALATVLQILDDLGNADTDLQKASATAARPVMGLRGASLGKTAPAYNPGEVWETGEGELYTLDTSRALDALLKYIEALLARLAVSARTPDALLGRVKPSEVPSGVALALGFGPLAAMISEMRLSRSEKHPLLLKFLHRMNLAGRRTDVPAWFPATIHLGSYLPQDRDAVIQAVRALLTPPAAISRITAVKMLIAVGFAVSDAEDEVARIEREDFVGAADIHSATGSTDTVYEYLQRDKPDDVVNRPAAPPVVPPGGTNVPPAPGNPNA